MIDEYTPDEQAQLLHIARQTLDTVTSGGMRPQVDLQVLPPRLNFANICGILILKSNFFPFRKILNFQMGKNME